MRFARGPKPVRWLVSVTVVAIALSWLAACGRDDGAAEPPEDGVRTVEVAPRDILFEPDGIDVEMGGTVRFVVTNEGAVPHEFVLGDEDVQAAHEQGMGGMDHGDMDTGADMARLTLEAGETKEATVTFDEAGEILYGCRVEGHHAAGMVGSVSVS